MSESVRMMFSKIAKKYDLANDVISLGFHDHWRKAAFEFALSNLKESPNDMLDICTGTGDMVAEAIKALPTVRSIVGLDFSPEMVEVARERFTSQRFCSFVVGDALSLPFNESSFDLSTIVFGIRNVDDPGLALREMWRILKPGGICLVVEFGYPKNNRLFSFMYELYSKSFLPLAGALIGGDLKAYKYLPNTIKTFPSGNEFLELMKISNFCDLKEKNLFLGIVRAYLGFKSKI